MKRSASIIMAMAFVALAACTPAPDYAAPGDAEARTAYLAAYEADWFGNSSDEHLADVPEHLRETHSAMMNPDDEKVAAETLRNTKDIKVGACEWTVYHPRRHRVEMRSKPRIENKFRAAYLCDVTVFVSTKKRGMVSAPARGFFFKDGETLSFAGEYAHGWAEVEQAGAKQGSTETGGAWGKAGGTPSGGWGAGYGG